MSLSRAVSVTSLSLALFVIGCGDDDGGMTTMDGGTDAGVDAGPPTSIEDLPIEAEVTLPSLGEDVDAVQDDRGMWHIYASTLEAATRVEGYLMARDRMGQMDFFRRAAGGRLAEFAGSVRPDLIEDDVEARFAGHRRNAELIWPTLSAEEQMLLTAFSEGITAYIEELRSGDAELPAGVIDVLSVDSIEDWQPIDTLMIVRIQSASLSLDAGDDVGLTEAMVAWQMAFPADSPDPAIAARAPLFHDLFTFRPARDVSVIDGWPNVTTDTGTRALRIPRERPSATPSRTYGPETREQLAAARRFLERIEAKYAELFGDPGVRGSNSWVVHGSHTASGRPILANDPHLSLTSPPLFWMVHINTARKGGDVDVQGLALVGTPVVLLGYNQHIAWGLTTHGYDVTDAYFETITPGAAGAPDTVLFNGAQVPIETITETIRLDTGGTMEVTFERVPHHGLIIPETRTETSAISIRWTGNEPSNEARAIMGLNRAMSVDEARDALQSFGVGGQTFVVIDRAGNIYETSQVRLPLRDARALTYDPATRMGHSPCMVLPGTGEYEWIGDMEDRYIPHVLNPPEGFIVTANADAVGATFDGNPFNEPMVGATELFIGCSFNEGHRHFRIRERVQELVTRGDVTPEEMSAVQADAQSPFGRILTPTLIAELDRAEAEIATPGTHPDLAPAIAAAGTDKMTKILALRDRLRAWTTFDTPAGVGDGATEAQQADSVAATIFNGVRPRLLHLAYDDEFMALGIGPKSDPTARAIVHATLDESSPANVFWDDLATADVTETRGDRVVRAFTGALDFLEMQLGADVAMWQWGRLHTLRLNTIVPQIMDVLSIPPAGMPPFPRHGDEEVVDASGYGDLDTTDYSYGSGPQQRLVVEMTADGPRVWNAIPGGQSIDPASPHHADEMEHWRRNEAPPMYFTEPDLLPHAERRLRFR